MLDPGDLRTVVLTELNDLFAETNHETRAVSGTELLGDLGLSSLLLARLILGLEKTVGVDPFDGDVAISDMRSLEDLIGAYQHAVARNGAGRPRVLARPTPEGEGSVRQPGSGDW